MTTEQVRQAVRDMARLKTHPREESVNRYLLQRAERLYQQLGTEEARDAWPASGRLRGGVEFARHTCRRIESQCAWKSFSTSTIPTPRRRPVSHERDIGRIDAAGRRGCTRGRSGLVARGSPPGNAGESGGGRFHAHANRTRGRVGRRRLRRGEAPATAFDAAVEERLSTRVEEFADSYWQLSPADRLSRWQELAEACKRYPRLVTRLRSLDQGLALELPTDLADTRQAGLVQLVAELYVLKPATRSSRRFYRLSELGAKQEVRAAARALNDSHPELGRIDNDLIDALISPTRQIEPIPIMSRPKPVDWVRSDYKSSGSSRQNSYRWLWVTLWICVMMCGGIMRSASNSTRNTDFDSSPFRSRSVEPDYPSYSTQNSGLSPEMRDAIAKILLTKKRIEFKFTGAQKRLLRELAKRDSLSNEEAEQLALKFHNRDMGEGASASSDNWDAFVKSQLTPAQQSVIDRLSSPVRPDFEVQWLLVQFVDAGKHGKSQQPHPDDAGIKP